MFKINHVGYFWLSRFYCFCFWHLNTHWCDVVNIQKSSKNYDMTREVSVLTCVIIINILLLYMWPYGPWCHVCPSSEKGVQYYQERQNLWLIIHKVVTCKFITLPTTITKFAPILKIVFEILKLYSLPNYISYTSDKDPVPSRGGCDPPLSFSLTLSVKTVYMSENCREFSRNRLEIVSTFANRIDMVVCRGTSLKQNSFDTLLAPLTDI